MSSYRLMAFRGKRAKHAQNKLHSPIETYNGQSERETLPVRQNYDTGHPGNKGRRPGAGKPRGVVLQLRNL